MQTTPMSLFGAPPILAGDPCASRHGGAETSRAAWERARPHRETMRARIMELARARAEGITTLEVAEALDVYPSSISGRLTELKAGGQLIYSLDADGKRLTRRGAAVLVLAEAGRADA